MSRPHAPKTKKTRIRPPLRGHRPTLPTRKPVPEQARTSERHPGTTKRYIRRRFKVEYLPEAARAQILSSFVAGKPYHQISNELLAQGVRISPTALSRYWRGCWQGEFEFLRHARACVALIAAALKQDPKGDLARIGRELLYTMVFQKTAFLRKADPFTLLHQAQQIDKLSPPPASSRSKAAPPSSLSDEDLEQTIRGIYGLPDPPDPKAPTHARNSKI